MESRFFFLPCFFFSFNLLNQKPTVFATRNAPVHSRLMWKFQTTKVFLHFTLSDCNIPTHIFLTLRERYVILRILLSCVMSYIILFLFTYHVNHVINTFLNSDKIKSNIIGEIIWAIYRFSKHFYLKP